jgi:uncharacterized membrane protein
MHSHLKSIAKAVSWRIIGAIDTFALAFLVTGKMSAAASVMSLEVVTKTGLYYFHERAWEKVPVKVAA